MIVKDDVSEWGETPERQRSRFRDNVWHLPPVGANSASASYELRWAAHPDAFREALKRSTWALLNRRTLVEMLERPAPFTPHPLHGTVKIHLSAISPFIQWLADQGITSAQEASEDEKRAYAEHVTLQPKSRAWKQGRLRALTRLWLVNQYLPVPDRLRQPPWELPGEETIAELVGPTKRAGENTTEPIDPDTWAALFQWCQWLIENLADDILRARDRRDEMAAQLRKRSKTGDDKRWKRYLSNLRRRGAALPGRMYRGRLSLAREYAALQAGVGLNSARRTHGLPIEMGAPLDIAIHGRIEGQPWTNAIDFYEVDAVVRHLATACLIVIALLTGMRGQEVRELKRGCCHRIDRGGLRPPGYEIWGKEFKVRGLDGATVPGGQERGRPWAGIIPVPRAFDVMERMHDHESLFPQVVFQPRGGRADRAVSSGSVNYGIERLMDWGNATAGQLGLRAYAIDDDPEGPVTLGRLRRTMARYIYRQPHGRLALGTQFGHLSLYTTDGYGTQSISNQRDVHQQEEALALGERLMTLSDRLERGEGVSGPAALPLIDAVTEYQGKHLTPEAFTDLLNNPNAQVHYNKRLHLTCHYIGAQAECHPEAGQHAGRERSPDLTHCNPKCANVAYTDSDIAAMSEEIRYLREQADAPDTSLPEHVRCMQRAERLEAIAAGHEANRIVSRREVT